MACVETPTPTDIEGILTRYPKRERSALIPILQEVQEARGYLSQEAIVRIGEYLHLPTSKIYGVATFYNQFRFQPLGQFHIQVCRGTACHVKGSAALLAALQQELAIAPGHTTGDGAFSLEVLSCVGACGLAPAICINGEFFADMTPSKTRRLLDAYRKKGGPNE